MGISSPDLLEEAIRNAEDLLDRLERERSTIDRRIGEVTEHLSKLRAEKDIAHANSPDPPKTRRRKGENARAILGIFDRDPAAALTKQEIADRTGLPFSSVQAILDKNDNGLVQEGGLWRRRKLASQ